MTDNEVTETGLAAVSALVSSDFLATLAEVADSLCRKAEKLREHAKASGNRDAIPVTKAMVAAETLNQLGVAVDDETLKAIEPVVTVIINLGGLPGFSLVRGQFGGLRRDAYEAPAAKAAEKAKPAAPKSATQRLAALLNQG